MINMGMTYCKFPNNPYAYFVRHHGKQINITRRAKNTLETFTYATIILDQCFQLLDKIDRSLLWILLKEGQLCIEIRRDYI